MRVLLFVSLAAGLVAQEPPLPFAQLQEYLQLSDSQVQALLQNLRDHGQGRAERQRQVDTLLREAAAEMARDSADPMVLGGKYAEVEQNCRAYRQYEDATRARAVELLTPAQRTRLAGLAEAARMFNVIAEAQALGLLAPQAVIGGSGTSVPLPGCQVRMEDLSGILIPSNLYFAAKQYLELTDAQYRRLLENRDSGLQGLSGNQQQAFALNRQISEETLKPEIDVAVLGALYADLSRLCREASQRSQQVQQQAVNLLEPAQRTKLGTLEAALRQQPLIAQAQAAGLLAGSYLGGGAVLVASGRIIDSQFGRLVLPGCSTGLGSFVF